MSYCPGIFSLSPVSGKWYVEHSFNKPEGKSCRSGSHYFSAGSRHRLGLCLAIQCVI